VTFAVVGARLGTPTQQGVTQLPSQTTVPLFDDFADSLTKDFMEVLGARGFGVRGPFKTYDEMIYPDKKGSDLTLTAEVRYSPDMSQLKFRRKTSSNDSVPPHPNDPCKIVGAVIVECHVNLVVTESLTNERMWTKSIAIQPFTVKLVSHHYYTLQSLAKYSRKDGEAFRTGVAIPIEVLLERENKFYSDLGRALETQYDEILNKIYGYLDPREMTIVKNQTMELRKKKVY
jgi:hypothetical protein